jgi:hypothetical protein
LTVLLAWTLADSLHPTFHVGKTGSNRVLKAKILERLTLGVVGRFRKKWLEKNPPMHPRDEQPKSSPSHGIGFDFARQVSALEVIIHCVDTVAMHKLQAEAAARIWPILVAI